MYEVNLNADPDHFLHWDKPLSEQSQHVQDALNTWNLIRMRESKASQKWFLAKPETGRGQPPDPGGDRRCVDLAGAAPNGKDFAAGSQALQDAGIPGIKYLDGSSRAAGEGSHNYVMFNPANIEILRKYGLAGLMAGAGGAASYAQPQGQSQ